jgi:hypothetical protein
MKSMSHKDACKNLRSFKLRWMNTWHKQRSKKEAAFIWAVWNKAVAVNLGEPKQPALRLKAASYGWEEEESIMHRFWDYIHARRAWEFTNKIINLVVYGSACPGTLFASRTQPLLVIEQR